MIRFRAKLAITLYLTLTYILQPLAVLVLKVRLRKGKEEPERYKEKLGYSNIKKPDGKLIWLHAVGVGEVLTLPILVNKLLELQPNLQFLLTSTSKTSAIAINNNLPKNCRHQYLVLDCPTAIKKFLKHWQPDLAIWVEQDIWPAMTYYLRQYKIANLILNLRMNDKSLQKKLRWQSLFNYVYNCVSYISCQDQISANNVGKLSGRNDIAVHKSLKQFPLPLKHNRIFTEYWRQQLQDRQLWLAASVHLAELDTVIACQQLLLKQQQNNCLLLVPRYPEQAQKFIEKLELANLNYSVHQQLNTTDANLKADTNVILAATIGELGTWYRLVNKALIGGSFCEIQGHNPFEAIALQCRVYSGPNTDNFAEDYKQLYNAGAATCVANAQELAGQLSNAGSTNSDNTNAAAQNFVNNNSKLLTQYCTNVLHYIDET